ncbi:DUF922 domain-containing protein [Arenimonas malthae]|uniref:DUF922 domain-containing protein n=1 Tax=Arenimonas malthae TaxID=354197 RepID=UPI0005C1942F|nr:DUF922 domain-containing protein [Arenimonas malthae]
MRGAGWFATVLLTLAGAAAPPPADDPGFVYTERREYYRVDGRRVDTLKRQLDAALSRKGLEGEGVGRTVQHLSSRYEFEPTPAGCRFKDLAVSLDVTIHLPRWEPKGGKPKGLAGRWERMLDALTRHEEGHRDIAVDTARRLLADLRALPETLDCQGLAREAQKAFFQARLRHSIRDGAYERRTNHGIAQGARL